MGEIAATSIILVLLAPKPTGNESGKGEKTAKKRKYVSQKELLDKIKLTGLVDWRQDEQKRYENS